MDEDFFLPDFSLEDIDFDFNIFEEDISSPDEANVDSQSVQPSSNLDHFEFLREEKPKSSVKPMMKKINKKPQMISFDFSSNAPSSPDTEEIIMEQLVSRRTKRKTCYKSTRSPVLAKEHVLAERKRREKLSEKFIALSALLPGLKKADKITVLDDAISRVKQLQEQTRKLIEEKEATRDMESMIIVKKSELFFDKEPSSLSDHNQFDQALPQIETKVSQNDVLIRIHCEKSKGCMIKILNIISKYHLCIENSIVLPFGDLTLDITVLAQMEKDFSVSVLEDLVRNLRLAMV